MRNKNKQFAFTLALSVMILLKGSMGLAQDGVLTLENPKWHKRISISQGSKMQYRILSSSRSSKGIITSATDSTITIENANSGMATILLKEISSLYVNNRLVGDLTAPRTNYNIKKVRLILTDGKTIKGSMSIKGDSVLIRINKKKVEATAYQQIEVIKIHRKGAGIVSGLLIGLGGAGIGAALGATGEGATSSKNYGSGTSTGAGAIAGFIIAFPIGVAAKPFNNKPQIIHGDRQKFEVFKERVNARLWIVRSTQKNNSFA